MCKAAMWVKVLVIWESDCVMYIWDFGLSFDLGRWFWRNPDEWDEGENGCSCFLARFDFQSAQFECIEYIRNHVKHSHHTP